MKLLLFSTTVLLTSTLTGLAGTKVDLSEVPEPVKAVILKYFPDSKLLTAEQEKGKYEIKIMYKDIMLEVEASPSGDLLDIEMK